GEVHASFDLPVKALRKGGPEPLSADLRLEGIVLEALGPLFQVELPAKGSALVHVQAQGTALKPRVEAHAEVHDAEWTVKDRLGDMHVPVDALVLDVTPNDDGALAAAVTLTAFGANAEVKLATPLTVEGLRAHPPTA